MLEAFPSYSLQRDWVSAKAQAVDYFIELYVAKGDSGQVAFRKGKLYDISSASNLGFGLRLLSPSGQEGLGFCSEGVCSPEFLEKTFSQAKSSLEHSPRDPFRVGLWDVEHSRASDAKKEDLDIFDATIQTRANKSATTNFLEDLLARLAKKKNISEVLRMGLSLDCEESVLISSAGVFCQETSTTASAGVSLVASDASGIQTYGGGLTGRHFKQILEDMPAVVDKSASIAAGLLGARSVASGSYPVVFDPWVAEEILSLVSDTFCADGVQRGKSPWRGKLGEVVASPLITIVDDGRLARGVASFLYDDEGAATQKTVLVDGGILKSFLYDSYTARRGGTKTSGNASRSFDSAPSPGTWNVYIKKGAKSQKQILKDTKRGIYVVDLMGLHTVDTLSGDFSLGASGFFIEGGELAYPVEKLTIAGNLYDLLKKIDAVGSDLKFHGAVASPTLRVEALQVGGMN